MWNMSKSDNYIMRNRTIYENFICYMLCRGVKHKKNRVHFVEKIKKEIKKIKKINYKKY